MAAAEMLSTPESVVASKIESNGELIFQFLDKGMGCKSQASNRFLMRLIPVLAHANFRNQRDFQLRDMRHQLR